MLFQLAIPLNKKRGRLSEKHRKHGFRTMFYDLIDWINEKRSMLPSLLNDAWAMLLLFLFISSYDDDE